MLYYVFKLFSKTVWVIQCSLQDVRSNIKTEEGKKIEAT